MSIRVEQCVRFASSLSIIMISQNPTYCFFNTNFQSLICLYLLSLGIQQIILCNVYQVKKPNYVVVLLGLNLVRYSNLPDPCTHFKV